uniref:Uncharacterized protein n=1 Tax=Rhipicephalus appendiculatus TaxID=34631 RepID=A0A131YEE4_RHIAP
MQLSRVTTMISTCYAPLSGSHSWHSLEKMHNLATCFATPSPVVGTAHQIKRGGQKLKSDKKHAFAVITLYKNACTAAASCHTVH